MKRILLFLSVFTLVLFSCDKNDETDKGKLDPNAMITIRPASGVQLRATIPGLTALEIVEQAYEIKWQSHWFNNEYWEKEKIISRGLNETLKDFDKPAFKMYADDIIRDGEYRHDLPYAFNVVVTNMRVVDDGIITRRLYDTIAYIPDETINAARIKIESAFADGNYNEVNRIFDEAFTFLPMPE